MASAIPLLLLFILGGVLVACICAFPLCRGNRSLLNSMRTHQCRDLSSRAYSLSEGGNEGNVRANIVETFDGGVDDDDFDEDPVYASTVTNHPSVRRYPAIKRALKRLFYDLPTATVSFPFLKHYVSRPSLEAKILEVYNRSYRGGQCTYTVLIGPQGAGKKFATAHALENKPGVLYLRVSNTETQASLLRKILETTGERVEEQGYLSLEILNPFLQQIPLDDNNRSFTVVLEVERGAPVRVTDAAGAAAKKLALAANVIVILSDVHDVPQFDFDPRQKFFWVDGMTSEEATAYAKTLYPAIADHDLELFLDKVCYVHVTFFQYLGFCVLGTCTF